MNTPLKNTEIPIAHFLPFYILAANSEECLQNPVSTKNVFHRILESDLGNFPAVILVNPVIMGTTIDYGEVQRSSHMLSSLPCSDDLEDW